MCMVFSELNGLAHLTTGNHLRTPNTLSLIKTGSFSVYWYGCAFGETYSVTAKTKWAWFMFHCEHGSYKLRRVQGRLKVIFNVCRTGFKFKIVNFNTYWEKIKISLIMYRQGISTSNKTTGLYSKNKYPTTLLTNRLKLLNIQYVQKITPKIQLKFKWLSFHAQLYHRCLNYWIIWSW